MEEYWRGDEDSRSWKCTDFQRPLDGAVLLELCFNESGHLFYTRSATLRPCNIRTSTLQYSFTIPHQPVTVQGIPPALNEGRNRTKITKSTWIIYQILNSNFVLSCVTFVSSVYCVLTPIIFVVVGFSPSCSFDLLNPGSIGLMFTASLQ